MEIYVLDGNLQQVGIVDVYKSLIWAKRYWAPGDCELYLPATTESLDLLRIDRYLVRLDDDMVCQIKRIQLDTDPENGNYLIVTGYDVKRLLHTRIIWNTAYIDGNVELAIRSMVNDALCDSSTYLGQLRLLKKTNGTQLMQLGRLAGVLFDSTRQISYKNLGVTVEDFCREFKCGYRVTLSAEMLNFELFLGRDLRDSIRFSSEYENLVATQYVTDASNLGNVALVAGSGEGPARIKQTYGSFTGSARYEIFVDAKDVSKAVTWEELTKEYPPIESGGQGYIDDTGGELSPYVYRMRQINIQIYTPQQLALLRMLYPDGQLITVDGTEYYQIYDATIASLQTETPDSGEEELWSDSVYQTMLLGLGAQKVSEYGATTSFDGTISPNGSFVYKVDFDIGDIVTIESEYGIVVAARITEVVEVDDDSGNKIELKYEYIQED